MNMTPVPNDAANDESRHDLARLQGVWEQVRMEADGVVDPPDEHGGPGAFTTIAGNHFSVRTTEGVLLLEGAFMLDASTQPKSITWIDSVGADKGKRLPASYTLDGDHFEFIAGEEGMPRPTKFHTVSGQIMRTFVRPR
jgi:uncharacterized protein (TIGR03067 family)